MRKIFLAVALSLTLATCGCSWLFSGGSSFVNTKALNHNGTDQYSSASASSAFALGTSGAISVWAKWTSSIVEYQDFVSCFYPTGGATGFSFWMIGHKPSLYISDGVGSSVATSTGSALSDDTYYHIVATWTGTTLKFYVDGSQHGSDLTISVGAGDSGVALHVGADTNSSVSRFFPGDLDEISIWNTYLDAAGVAALRTGAGKPANLLVHPNVANGVVWWREGDSPDTISGITDRFGNGHTLTPQNMTSGNIVTDVP